VDFKVELEELNSTDKGRAEGEKGGAELDSNYGAGRHLSDR
jgi:hypothetical protein